MFLKIYNIQDYLIRLILLMHALAVGMPFTENETQQRPPPNNATSHDRISTPDYNGRTEHILERPCHFWNDIKGMGTSSDIKIHKEINANEHFKRLCWAELLILTEDNKSKNKTLSTEYSIILENPRDDSSDLTFKEQIIEPYEIFDEVTNKSKTLNFTTIGRTNDATIKEHRTMFCGTGPVLTKIYYEWPKLNKEKIEIRLSPTTCTSWRVHDENANLKQIQYTQFPSYSTFDTTVTNPDFTTTETVMEDVFRITDSPYLLQDNPNKQNKFKINSNKSTSQLYEFDEMFGPHISSKNTDVLRSNEEENILGSDNKKMNENDVLDPLENPDVLGQSKPRTNENERRTTFSPTSDWTVPNVSEPLKATDDFTGAPPFLKFKPKLDENDRRPTFSPTSGRTVQNVSEPLKTTDDSSGVPLLLNLICSSKPLTNLLSANSSNDKFISKISVHLEHRIVDNVNDTINEKTDSVVDIEEERVIHVKSKIF